MTASCHHIHSHSLVPVGVVSQFHTHSTVGQKETGERKQDKDTEAGRETQTGHSWDHRKTESLTLSRAEDRPWRKGRSSCRCLSGPGSWPAARGRSGFLGSCRSWSGAEGETEVGAVWKGERTWALIDISCLQRLGFCTWISPVMGCGVLMSSVGCNKKGCNREKIDDYMLM